MPKTNWAIKFTLLASPNSAPAAGCWRRLVIVMQDTAGRAKKRVNLGKDKEILQWVKVMLVCKPWPQYLLEIGDLQNFVPVMLARKITSQKSPTVL